MARKKTKRTTVRDGDIKLTITVADTNNVSKRKAKKRSTRKRRRRSSSFFD